MSQNDPQWGRRRGEGPPDLDEILARFNQRLSALFGRKRPSGGSPGSGSPRMGAGGLGLLAGLVAAVWLASGFYIVDAGQKGVVLRFGRFVETTDSGPRWHLPYPIETAEVVNISGVRTIEVGYRNDVRSKVPKEALMLTDDENIVDLQFAVQYVLKDATEFLFNNRSPEDAVRQVAESAIREIVGKSRMDFVLYEGREQIAIEAKRRIQETLDRYRTGISVSQVTMQNAQPPEQVQAAFADAVKANQDRERQKNEGEAYSNDVIPKARGTAARLLQEAEGYKQRTIATAQGEAQRFRDVLVEYRKAPAVTRDRLYIDMMQQVLSSTSKVIVDQRSGSNVLFLPLDKILQLSASGAPEAMPKAPVAAEPAPSAPVPAAPAPDPASRSRDAFRNRDREPR